VVVEEVAMIETLRWWAESEVQDGPFAAPGYLWLLAVIPVIVIVQIIAAQRHAARLRAMFSGEVLERVWPRGVRTRRTIRDVALLGALALGIIALSGPRFDKRVQLIEARGVDLVLVVDLSRSMDAQDIEPSRLERARREIYDLIELMEGDRVGLVVFAGGAYPRIPLTDDKEALRMIVSEMSTRDFQAQGSALHEALRVGIELLSRPSAGDSGKAIIVLSDGEIHDVPPVLEQAAAARRAGIRVFSMLVGDAAAPIPLGNGAWQTDRQGRRVISTPSDQVLKEIAQIGGGVFTRSVASDEDMRALYRGGVRTLLDAGVRGVRPKIRWRSAWGWPLGVAVALGLVGAWLGEGRRRWGMAAAVLLAWSIVVPSGAWASSVAQGDRAYREGDFVEATRIFNEISHRQPEDPSVFERLGAARYRAGDVDGAIRAWEHQARLEGRARRDTLFNLGNANARSGRYQRAIELYDEVLARGPHEGAERNRDLVFERLEQQEQQEQQSQQGEDNEPSDGSSAPSDPSQGSEGSDDPSEQGDRSESSESQDAGDDPEGSSGQADGQTDEGDRSMSGDQKTQQDGGNKDPGEDQERQDDSELTGVRPDELDDREPSDGNSGTPNGQPVELDAEAQAVQQAEKLLDGVQEGRPRITIPGGSQDRPW
jgi:Ca-activated chloride channel family protein